MIQNVFFFLHTKDKVRYLYGNMNIREAMQNMKLHHYTAMPVIDNTGHYIGSISEGDFLWYLDDHPRIHKQKVMIEELIRPDYMPAQKSNVSLPELFQQSLNQNFVPIVDDRNIFIGIVTRRSILEYLMHQMENKDIVIQDKEPISN